MKSQKRQKQFAQKRATKENRMKKPGYKSNYAKKRLFLISNGGWGFDYPDKPWK